jgi:hypothetical protein
MEKEIEALLEHARYCRQIAAETSHKDAAQKLLELATDFEARARALRERLD